MKYQYQVSFSFEADDDARANDVAHSFSRTLQKMPLLPFCKTSEKLLEIESGVLIKRAVWER